MPDNSVTVVAIDDDPQALALISAALDQSGVEVLTEQNPARGLELVRRIRPRIVLVDLMMPGMSGLEVLDGIVETDPAIDVILLTSHYSSETAVQAIQRGACDYINKPVDIEKLQNRVAAMVAEFRRIDQARLLDRKMIATSKFEGIIGRSPLILDVFARIQRVAPHFRSALVTGPSGTGKEQVAKALHRLSPSSNGPLVICNCAAIPETLVESELFGHVRGAFTGATMDKAGLFEHANNGTLFLDEIGEMPLAAQSRLPRAVQQHEVQRVGSPILRKVNVRIIAATNRNLRAAIRDKEFREDLFFRLSMVEIRLPALAERKEDLPLLIRHFVDLFAAQYGKRIEGLTRRAEAMLARNSWPGNIRQLENLIGYACMMADSDRLDIHDFPREEFHAAEAVSSSHQAAGAGGFDYPMVSLDAMDRLHAKRVLELSGGDKVAAAQTLGVSRSTLYRLLSLADAQSA